MGFFRTLLLIVLVWQLLKWGMKLYLRFLIKKRGGFFSSFQSQSNEGQGFSGNIKVKNSGRPTFERDKGSLDKLGEYVDFEEVK
jgi:hypothetical protein